MKKIYSENKQQGILTVLENNLFSTKEGNSWGIKEQQKKILRHRKQQNSRHKSSLISNYIKCKLIGHSNQNPVTDRMGKKPTIQLDVI